MAKFTITSQNYYRTALFFPYFIWVICAAIPFITIITDDRQEWLSWFGLGELFAIIFFSIFFWFVPYTIIVIVLLIWSKISDVKKFIQAINFSPLMLAVIIWTAPIGWGGAAEIFGVKTNNTFLIEWLFLAVISIVIGYVLVAIFHGLYRLLKNKNIVTEV